LLLSAGVMAKPVISIQSPDAKIKFWLSTDNNGLFYKLSYKGVLMVDVSRLKISFKDGGLFNSNLRLTPAKPERLTEDYELITGKASKIHSECNRITVPVTEQSGAKRTLDIEIRVFNDGLAFRYVIPKQNSLPETVYITDELDGF